MRSWGQRWRKLAVAGALTLLLISLAAPLSAQTSSASWPETLERVINLVQAYYHKPVTAEQLWQGAINGALETLEDPYTTYMAPEEFESFTDDIEGHLVGVGINIERVGAYITVQSPISGSPAEAAGLQAGDRILEVDGRSIVEFTPDAAAKLIRGEAGTPVRLRIERPAEGRVFEVTIIRAEIEIPIVESEMLPGGVGYVRIHSFSSDLGRRFGNVIKEMQGQGLKGLVLDLRNNPGGYLNAATDMAGYFIPRGETAVLQVGRSGIQQPTVVLGQPLNLPTVVLVNEGSASASEILAGALQDYGVATIVGTRTYGKGTVQSLIDLAGGSVLKVTTAEYLTPKGRKVHGVGIQPDVEVPALPMSPERIQALELSQGYSLGQISLEIQAVQQRLNDLGYNAGSENGFFSRRLQQAIEAFQADQGLAVTGRIDGEFVQALNQAVAQHAAELRKQDVQREEALAVLRDLMAGQKAAEQ